MRLDPEQTRDDLLRQLERQAEATWGAERLEALRPSLQATAEALWQITRQPPKLEDSGS